MADVLAIKGHVFETLKTALPDFEVTWGFTKKNPPRLWCYLGEISWPQAEWATNRSREYECSIPIVLNAIKVRTDPETVERWLGAQLVLIETAFNASSTLRTLGVISWSLRPRALGSQPHTDGIEGQSVIELSVTYRP